MHNDAARARATRGFFAHPPTSMLRRDYGELTAGAVRDFARLEIELGDETAARICLPANQPEGRTD